MSPIYQHGSRTFFLALILMFISNLAFATLDLSAPIPIDPTVKIGQLKNGLRYYIKKNATPKNKVELRLIVKAGSLEEDDNQLGVAHFVEHLAFQNTRHFKNNSLIATMQAMGMKFGADLNFCIVLIIS